MLNEDCYKLLRISSDANEKTIRKAYRDLAKELHPDKNPSADAAQQFAKLAAALATLTDPVERLKHDDRFGYNKPPRHQGENAKQRFSEFQKDKAEHLVKEWSTDYEKAMAMREEQRRSVIRMHKRRQAATLICIVLFLLVLLFVFFTFNLDDLPAQK
jgi:DnaJ-class molecular chaperone